MDIPSSKLTLNLTNLCRRLGLTSQPVSDADISNLGMRKAVYYIISTSQGIVS